MRETCGGRVQGGWIVHPASNPSVARARLPRSRWRRVEWQTPCPMLTASIGPLPIRGYEAVHTPAGAVFLPTHLQAGVATHLPRFAGNVSGARYGDQEEPAN